MDDWYKDGIIYQTHVRAFFDSNGDGIGDFRRAFAEARLSAGPRRRHDLAAAVLSLAAARRRVRHRRLHGGPSELRHARRLQGVPARGAPPRAACHHRDGHQSHQRPARVVPEIAAREAGLAVARLLRLERHARQVPRRAHHLQGLTRRRTGRGTRSRSRITGTASSPISPT